jgi:hypothetical protein
MESTEFLGLTPCCLVDAHKVFVVTYGLHLQNCSYDK